MSKVKKVLQKKSPKQFTPSYPEILNLANRGNLFLSQGQLESAIESYQKVLSFKPDFAEVHNNLGVALQQQGKFTLAIECHQRALALKPAYPQAHLNLGMAFNDLEQFDAAVAQYQQTILLEPNYADAHYNLAIALKNQRNFTQAIASYRHALLLNPNFVEASLNLGFLLLSLGQFAEGWQRYELRSHPSIKNRNTIPPRLNFPQWQGESLKEKSLVIWREQGLGDEIQFCRYVPMLKQQGAKHITWVGKKPLKGLLTTVPGIDAVLTEEEAVLMPPHDYWTFPLSMPLHCQTTLDTIPATVPYFYAQPERITELAAQLSHISAVKVGVCWKGSPTFRDEYKRSPGIAPFSELFNMTDVRFFTLQPGTRIEFINAAGKSGVDLGREIDENTFEDAAALIMNLDLVITSCTSICHLAGALGKPVWIVLPFEADWRWLINREDSLWYPTARLFQQVQRGDWTEVFDRVAHQLTEFVNQAHSM